MAVGSPSPAGPGLHPPDARPPNNRPCPPATAACSDWPARQAILPAHLMPSVGKDFFAAAVQVLTRADMADAHGAATGGGGFQWGHGSRW